MTQQNGDEYNYTACGVLQVTLLILLLIYSVVLQTVSLIQIQINVKKKETVIHIVQERTRGMQYLYRQK